MTEKTLEQRALELYQPPFKYIHGYIQDANHHTVADNDGGDAAPLRVRGWGRIGYMQDGEALQDEVGRLIAEKLTAAWRAGPGKEIAACWRAADAGDLSQYDIMIEAKKVWLNAIWNDGLIDHTMRFARAVLALRHTATDAGDLSGNMRLFAIGKKLEDEEIDEQKLIRIGAELVALSGVCQSCHGEGQEGDAPDANGEGGWIGPCSACTGTGKARHTAVMAGDLFAEFVRLRKLLKVPGYCAGTLHTEREAFDLAIDAAPPAGFVVDQRERFEQACYAHYLARHAAGKTPDHLEPTGPRETLLWRDDDGNYGVLMFNASWWAWQEALK